MQQTAHSVHINVQVRAFEWLHECRFWDASQPQLSSVLSSVHWLICSLLAVKHLDLLSVHGKAEIICV